MQDASKKGRAAFGERNGKAKLTLEIVHAMRLMRVNGKAFVAIGKAFNVSSRSARCAVIGLAWKDA
jgi:hypothetical protein